MKMIVFLLLLISPLPAFSQQNYFNVPSFEITGKDTFFFQQQLNVNDSIESNSTFDWGLKDNMEIGLNVYGVQVNNPLTARDNTNGKFEHLTLMNLQKSFPVSSLSLIHISEPTR